MELATRRMKLPGCGAHSVAVVAFGLGIALVIGVNVSFLLGYFLAVSQITAQPDFVYYYPNWEYQIDRNSPTMGKIMESREYQIRLPPSKYTANRTAAIEELAAMLQEATGIKLKRGDSSVSLYQEIQYDTRACGHQFSELRRRVLFNPENGQPVGGNTTTIDINNDGVPRTDKRDALRWNLTVAEHYKGEEKIEQGTFNGASEEHHSDT
jgi:hypothetical protein